MNVLTIQSHVVYGHVGNSVAAFALQRLGFEAWALHTVLFSNHPGYGRFGGAPVEPERIAAQVDGLDAIGALARCDGVLTGYIGAAGTVAAVTDAVSRARMASPAALYCCDPVIGDDGRIYVGAGVFEAVRDRLLPMAQIVTPNAFELGLLTGLPVADGAQAVAALTALRARGPGLAVLTSFAPDDAAEASLDMIAADAQGAWRVRTPRLPRSFNGAGDLVAALILAHRLRGLTTPDALARAASSAHAILSATVAAGERELALIAAQEALIAPPRLFAAEPV
jgi:pyridoxine kinase